MRLQLNIFFCMRLLSANSATPVSSTSLFAEFKFLKRLCVAFINEIVAMYAETHILTRLRMCVCNKIKIFNWYVQGRSIST